MFFEERDFFVINYPDIAVASFAFEVMGHAEPTPVFDYRVPAVLTFQGEVDVEQLVRKWHRTFSLRAGARACLSAIGAPVGRLPTMAITIYSGRPVNHPDIATFYGG